MRHMRYSNMGVRPTIALDRRQWLARLMRGVGFSDEFRLLARLKSAHKSTNNG